MPTRLNAELFYAIMAIVEEIPVGKVATYGQIARLSGYEKNARLVGKIVAMSGYYGVFPCHRVVNSQGRCAPYWLAQRERLINEGVSFKLNGCVNLRISQWINM